MKFVNITEWNIMDKVNGIIEREEGYLVFGLIVSLSDNLHNVSHKVTNELILVFQSSNLLRKEIKYYNNNHLVKSVSYLPNKCKYLATPLQIPITCESPPHVASQAINWLSFYL